MIEVTSLNDPNIQEFTSLRSRQFNSNKYFVCESRIAIEKLLKSSLNVLKVFGTKEEISKLDINSDSDIYFGSSKILESIVGHKKHQSIMAMAEIPKFTEIDKLDDRLIILNGLTSPENVGSIIRNSMAFGFNSILFDNETVSPYSRRCVSVSRGNIFNSKISKSYSLYKDIKKLKELGYQIIATANEEGSIPLESFKSDKKIAFIIGSEGHGIERDLIEISDKKVKISVDESVKHLNASHSASIIMFYLNNIQD